MKYTLGRILLFLLLINSFAYAELATYTLKADKKTAYVKEPIVVTFIAKQKEYTDHMFFSLEPKTSDDYKIVLLKKEIADKSAHNSIATFTYLLFPLKAKKIEVDFDFLVKTASDKAIKQSYVDDHDDSIAISTYDTHMPTKALQIEVKPIKDNVDLVGDFKLTSSIDKKQITQFEELNVHYQLVGKGYRVKGLTLLHKTDKNITLFQDTHDTIDKPTKEGYIIKKEYIYALSAKKSFTVPSITLHAYSPSQERYYTLSVPKQEIKVLPIDTKKLLENKEYPTRKHFDITPYKNAFVAILLFIAGFITAKLSDKIEFTKKKVLFEDIKKAQTPQALILILLQKYHTKNINKFIDILEQIQYDKDNTKTTLKEIKESIIKELS